MTNYQEQLNQEAELWGSESERMAQEVPPDWRLHQHLRHNVLMHRDTINALLEHIQPKMKTLELGCASGWLTLAMAQNGADATGLDISDKSLTVARNYYESIQDEVAGSVDYQVADLNQLDLPANTYDVIAVKGTLHHLINLPQVIAQVHQGLKVGGLFWVHDTDGDEGTSTVLVASGLMFLLPTHVSYIEKIKGLLKFGTRAPSRIKASMEAEGLSPFEGAGRDHDWLSLMEEQFTIEERHNDPAITGYLTAQINLPDGIAIPLLKFIRAFDRLFVKLGLLKNTGVTIYARKTD